MKSLRIVDICVAPCVYYVSIFSCCHVSCWSAGLLQQDTPLGLNGVRRAHRANCSESKLSFCFFLTVFDEFEHNPPCCFTLNRLNAAMTREEDLIRIAKKLDKMVSRNNTVRRFDTHRWRVVLPPRAVHKARERFFSLWNVSLLSI